MIKRPLNWQFREPVLHDQKTTTIRNNPWPVGVPIMLYNWSGKPYHSKQADVAAVIVKGFWTIRITHHEDGQMSYEYGRENGPPLHETEGFSSRAALDEWFRPLVKRGQTVTKTLMHFSRLGSKMSALNPLAHA
jgi:hypothetical protein